MANGYIDEATGQWVGLPDMNNMGGQSISPVYQNWLAQGNDPSAETMPLDVFMAWQGDRTVNPDGTIQGTTGRLNPETGMVDFKLQSTSAWDDFKEFIEVPAIFATMIAAGGGINSWLGGAGSAAGAAGEIAALTGSGVPVGGALGTGATAAGIGGSFLDGVSSFFKEYVGDPMSRVFDKASSFFDSALPSATKGAEVMGQVGMGGGSGGLGAAQQVAGLSTNPASVVLDGATGAFDMGVGGVGEAMGLTQAAPAVSPGILNSVVDWAKANPKLATTGAQLVFGAMKGAGDREAADNMMEKRIQADQALLAQRTEEAKELDEWKRRFTQAGSFFDAPVPKANANATQLRRPDGSLVYSNGIIANQVGG